MSYNGQENSDTDKTPMDLNQPDQFAGAIEHTYNSTAMQLTGDLDVYHRSLVSQLAESGLRLDRFLGAGVLSVTFSLTGNDGKSADIVARIDNQNLGKPLNNPFILQSPHIYALAEGNEEMSVTMMPRGDFYKNISRPDPDSLQAGSDMPINRLGSLYKLKDGEEIPYRELVGRVVESIGAMEATGGEALLEKIRDLNYSNFGGAFTTLPDPDKHNGNPAPISYQGKPVMFLADVSGASEKGYALGESIREHLEQDVAYAMAEHEVKAELKRQRFPEAKDSLTREQQDEFDKEHYGQMKNNETYQTQMAERVEAKRADYQAFIDEHLERGREMGRDPELLGKIERFNERIREQFSAQSAEETPTDTVAPKHSLKTNRSDRSEQR